MSSWGQSSVSFIAESSTLINKPTILYTCRAGKERASPCLLRNLQFYRGDKTCQQITIQLSVQCNGSGFKSAPDTRVHGCIPTAAESVLWKVSEFFTQEQMIELCCKKWINDYIGVKESSPSYRKKHHILIKISLWMERKYTGPEYFHKW